MFNSTLIQPAPVGVFAAQSTIALAQHGVEVRFRAMAKRGSIQSPTRTSGPQIPAKTS